MNDQRSFYNRRSADNPYMELWSPSALKQLHCETRPDAGKQMIAWLCGCARVQGAVSRLIRQWSLSWSLRTSAVQLSVQTSNGNADHEPEQKMHLMYRKIQLLFILVTRYREWTKLKQHTQSELYVYKKQQIVKESRSSEYHQERRMLIVF